MSLLDDEEILIERDPLYIAYTFHYGSMSPVKLSRFEKLSNYRGDIKDYDFIHDLINSYYTIYGVENILLNKMIDDMWFLTGAMNLLVLIYKYCGDIKKLEEYLTPYFKKHPRAKVDQVIIEQQKNGIIKFYLKYLNRDVKENFLILKPKSIKL